VPSRIHFLGDSALNDERLADYRDLQDRRLCSDSGRFVAESELVVRKLLATDLVIESVLLTAPRLASLEPLLMASRADFPTFVVPQGVMDGIAGFHVHRGCLAIAHKRKARIPEHSRLVVVLVDLVDVDNLGAMARNAAALGADAIMLSPTCADPFYRKAVRTSAGAVLSLPIVRASSWPADLIALRDEHELALVGAVLDAEAVPLADFTPPPRLALLLGAEGPGLSENIKVLCDALVTIPMAKSAAVDSLNVATAGALFLYHLVHIAPRGS